MIRALNERLLRLIVAAHVMLTLLDSDRTSRRRERGDVPGWVLVTLMTAGLVAVLWTLAGQRLQELFNQAMDSVSGR